MWSTPEEHKKLERQAIERPELDNGAALASRAYRMVDGAETATQKAVAMRYVELLKRRAVSRVILMDDGFNTLIGPWAAPYSVAGELTAGAA